MIGMLSELAQAMNGTLVGTDAMVHTVGVDSRLSAEGMLFFALRDARDGHAFALDAVNRGAVAAVVCRDALYSYPMPETVIIVEDTLQALSSLAKWQRERFDLMVIAVTGSNGKTTVKGMIASILNQAYPNAAYATPGNFNNAIGVPLSLLGLTKQHQAAVIEIGMNHPGEVSALASIVRPYVALVNNAQREHMAFFESVRDVANANAEVFAKTDRDGTLVLNADDQFYAHWQTMTGGRRIVSFGLNADADVTAENCVLNGSGARFTIKTPSGSRDVTIQALGEHNIRNALAAAACAWAAGIRFDAIVAGLASFLPVKGRLNRLRTIMGGIIIDDTYNANPDSMTAAIQVLAACDGFKLLILGDMGEVGLQGQAYHREIGQLADAAGIDALWTVGTLSEEAGKVFSREYVHFASKADLCTQLQLRLNAEMTVLVKGSRFMAMETVVLPFIEKKVQEI